MATEVNISFDPFDYASIVEASERLKKYFLWISRKTDELLERLRQIGVQEASVRFAEAFDYDGVNDTIVYSEPIEGGWQIIANGHAVCFIEFGAGVFYNSGSSYPDFPTSRVPGIVGIGQYGNHHGMNDSWWFTNQAGESQESFGNAAIKPMWHSATRMMNEMNRIAREVF